MPLNHENATATVKVTGLSVGCFNPDTRNWEVALIRHPCHELSINVTTRFPGNISTQTRFEVTDPGHTVYIETKEAVVPADNEVFFTRDPFDRKDKANSDEEDFRWIIDLEKDFNEGAPIKQITPAHPITNLFVAHPRLYADGDDKLDDMQLVKFAAGAGKAAAPEEFGSLAETAKADIICQPGGSVTLRIEGPMGVSLPLPHVEGATHEILIENICPEEGPGSTTRVKGQPAEKPSDFKIYFSMFKPTSGDAFDLKPKVPGQEGSDAVCNNTFLGSSKTLPPGGG